MYFSPVTWLWSEKVWFEAGVNEPAIKSLMERMKWVEKYPVPRLGTGNDFGTKSVTVQLQDGRQYSREMSLSWGMPQKPLTADEFNAKYRDCASAVLSEADVE
ncbi:MAG: hypothetical protein AB1714_14160 [Acidobacteriota bacterium]